MGDDVQRAVKALSPSWLETPIGQSLLERESRVVEEAFDGIFGEECLQLGIWGEKRTFLGFSRTQRSNCIARVSADIVGHSPGVIGQLHRLPVASDSVDSVFLPHTLEYSSRPHAILRAVPLRCCGRDPGPPGGASCAWRSLNRC